MKIIEKIFDIPIKDLEYLYSQLEDTFEVIFPNWDSFNCKAIQKMSLNAERTQYEFDLKGIRHLVLTSNFESYPLKIVFGIFSKNSFIPRKWDTYNKDDYGLIRISLSIKVLKIIQSVIIKNKLEGVQSFSIFEPYIDPLMYKDLPKIFSKQRLLNSLAHELSHYLDDAEHNRHLSLSLFLHNNKIKTLNQFYRNSNIDKSYMEFNAQVHAIANIRQRYLTIWDKMSILDLIDKDTSLLGLYRSMRSIDKQISNEWLLKIQKRLARENLLGLKMKIIPSDDSFLLEDFTDDVSEQMYKKMHENFERIKS